MQTVNVYTTYCCCTIVRATGVLRVIDAAHLLALKWSCLIMPVSSTIPQSTAGIYWFIENSEKPALLRAADAVCKNRQILEQKGEGSWAGTNTTLQNYTKSKRHYPRCGNNWDVHMHRQQQDAGYEGVQQGLPGGAPGSLTTSAAFVPSVP